MIEFIEKIISKYKGCFMEVYLEDGISTRIRCRGNTIEDISKSRNCGGHVNIIKNGYKSFVSFNNIRDLDSQIQCALNIIGITPVISSINIERDKIMYLENDVTADDIDILYKVDRIKSLNSKIISLEGIDSSVVAYGDSKKKVYYCNSYGSLIKQSKNDLIANFTAVIKGKNYVDILPLSFGSCGDFSVVDSAENEIDSLMNRINLNPNFTEIQSGNYPVVFDPEIGGVFIHEIIGHLLEADSLLKNKQLLNKLSFNKKVSTEIVTVEDRPDLIGYRGSYAYDDEGTKANGTTIIKKGILENYLHSCETAALFNTKPTGNARLLNYRYKPIVRMSNIVLNTGTTPFQDMISSIEYGIYLIGWKGANTDLDAFTIYPREAYLVKDGMISDRLKDIYIRGDINTFRNIENLGDKSFLNQGISCSKLNQRALPVSTTSPHIKLSSCFVAGIVV